jgi:magnesium transporter
MEFYFVSPEKVTGISELGEFSAIREQTFSAGFFWIDCIYSEVGQINGVLETLAIGPILSEHLDDASNRQHPSYFDSTSLYEMVVFRGLAVHASNLEIRNAVSHLESRPSTFFLLKGCIVTVHAQSSRTFSKVKARLLDSDDDRFSVLRTPEELMLKLLNEMVDRYLELREPLSKILEKIQYELLDPRKPFRDWHILFNWRVEIQRLETLSEEQHDAIQEWIDERHDKKQSVCGGPALTDSTQVRTYNIIEHIQRVISHSGRLESALDSAVQLHFSATAHRSTEIMRVLTVITAIFMPLTLITGIFGMNFEFIPGVNSRQGFWIALGFMLFVAVSMYVWFRMQRWVNTKGSKEPRNRRASDQPNGRSTTSTL